MNEYINENNNFHIPDITYQIPVQEFFKWYDDKIIKRYDNMTTEEIERYFYDLSYYECKTSIVKRMKESNKSNEEIKYFERDIELDKVRNENITHNIYYNTKNGRKEGCTYTHALDKKKLEVYKIYYRLNEFNKLQSDMVMLQKYMKEFLVEKSIKKMAGNNEKEPELWLSATKF